MSNFEVEITQFSVDEGGQVTCQGAVSYQGQRMTAFLMQPKYEPVFWDLQDGSLVTISEPAKLRSLAICLLSALVGVLHNDPSDANTAWQAGLQHGYEAAFSGNNTGGVGSELNLAWLQKQTWPLQADLNG